MMMRQCWRFIGWRRVETGGEECCCEGGGDQGVKVGSLSSSSSLSSTATPKVTAAVSGPGGQRGCSCRGKRVVKMAPWGRVIWKTFIYHMLKNSPPTSDPTPNPTSCADGHDVHTASKGPTDYSLVDKWSPGERSDAEFDCAVADDRGVIKNNIHIISMWQMRYHICRMWRMLQMRYHMWHMQYIRYLMRQTR